MTDLARTGAALLGGQLARAVTVSGGDLSGVVHIVLADGRDAIVKGGPAPRAEAAMLEALGAAGTPVPAVLAVDDRVLVLERLATDGGPAGAWADLGRVLARLHHARGPGYGWDRPYAFGPLAIDNDWVETWPEFWATRRLAVHVAGLPPALAARVEGLAGALAARLPRRPDPVLLHGDLWGGNVLARGGRISGLIDPACYYGHGEVDLAMLDLFDRPGAAFVAAYGALEPDWPARRPIYQLWPALVHLRLFGAGYRGLVENLLTAAGV